MWYQSQNGLVRQCGCFHSCLGLNFGCNKLKPSQYSHDTQVQRMFWQNLTQRFMCSSSTLLLPFIGLNIPTYLISAIASCHRKRSNHLFSTNFLVQKLQSTKDTSHSLYLLLNYMYVFKKLGKYQNFFTRSLGRINTWFP